MIQHFGPIWHSLMAEPATLTNKLFLRDLTPRKEEDPHCTNALGWDDPIPHQFQKQWDQMQATCRDVESLEIPRSFYPAGHGTPVHQQLFAFADASDLAWCYVIYLRTVTIDGCIHVAFVYGAICRDNPEVNDITPGKIRRIGEGKQLLVDGHTVPCRVE